MIHETAKIDATVRVYHGGGYWRNENLYLMGLLDIGLDCRIDAFTVITVGPKGIKIGRNVHVGVGCFISGAHGRVEIGDFCSLSPRSSIYTGVDDMLSNGLIGACAPADRRVPLAIGDVIMQTGSALGAGAFVWPDVVIGAGAVVGMGSVCRFRLEPGRILVGPEGRLIDKVRSTEKNSAANK